MLEDIDLLTRITSHLGALNSTRFRVRPFLKKQRCFKTQTCSLIQPRALQVALRRACAVPESSDERLLRRVQLICRGLHDKYIAIEIYGCGGKMLDCFCHDGESIGEDFGGMYELQDCFGILLQARSISVHELDEEGEDTGDVYACFAAPSWDCAAVCDSYQAPLRASHWRKHMH